MHAVKKLFSVSLLAGASVAHAAIVNLTGAQTEAESVPSVTTYFSCSAGATSATAATACISPVVGPSFSGVDWNVDTVTPSLTGTLVFAAFKSHVDVFSTYVADIFFADNQLTISGGARYNSVTRTLYIADAAFGATGSTPPSCNGATIICSALPTAPITGDISLTFDDYTLTSFTGIANTWQSTTGGTATTTLTFSSIPAAPVPATAWLFGSGLLSIAALRKRSRSRFYS